MSDSNKSLPARLSLLKGILPVNRAALLRDALAGLSLASMDIPQVLGYARIAGMPTVTGLYTAVPAAGRVCAVRRLASSGGGGGLGNRHHLRQPAFDHGADRAAPNMSRWRAWSRS